MILPDRTSIRALFLGLCVLLGNAYATQTREFSDGRYDILLTPRTPTLLGIIIELKAEKHCDTKQLQKLSQTALNQIEDKKYDTEMLTHVIKTICKYGCRIQWKNVEIVIKNQEVFFPMIDIID